MKNVRLQFIVIALCSVILAGCVGAGNLVWLDENGNGIQDSGEPGVAGVEITLHSADGEALTSAVSDADGGYALSVQSSGGVFYVAFELPEGYTFTEPLQGDDPALDSDVEPGTGRTRTLSLSSVDETIDAGLVLLETGTEVEPMVEEGPARAAITGRSWLDENANGLQDDGEPGLEGVLVQLLNSDGDAMDEKHTGPDGEYILDDVVTESNYQLAFFPPEGYEITQMDTGDDDSIDSDVGQLSGQTALHTLDAEGAVLDAGFVASGPTSMGPDEFPAGYNPLTGQPLCEPAAVDWGVVGISISQFPPAATRPATGLQWAAWVSEWWIGDGDTRLYAQFYGCYPEIDLDATLGDQAGDSQPEVGDGEFLIGDVAWYDLNGNAQQDAGEPGVPGIGVELILSSQVVASTTTDGAGRYSFVVEPQYGFTYQVRFTIPTHLQTFYFVSANLAADDVDSDPNPSTGLTDGFTLAEGASEKLDIDAGLRHSIIIEGVRSGRLVYEVMRGYFEGCTVIAGADPTVLAQIQVCAQAANNDANDIGAAGIDVTKLQEVAANNISIYGPPNLTGNLFDANPPDGCVPANSLTMFYNINNQTYWSYDEASGAYIRHQNTYLAPDVQEVSTEALTGEPQAFENVIVFFVEHEELNAAGTIIDVHMESRSGRAKLLRDGMVCDLNWSTVNGDYEKETGRTRPIRFEYADGTPFPLKPGQLFLHMVHINADFFEPEAGSGDWRARWYTP
ncbi:MAG: DUF3048 C-terminal domain-containing protein [Anaerolineales bacterium]|nr:MAG: DUF3048 C-terminal domain-containing protein [Anaerolineales bacterium]